MFTIRCKCKHCINGVIMKYWPNERKLSYNFHNTYMKDMIILNDELHDRRINIFLKDIKKVNS